MESGKTAKTVFYPILMHFAARYTSHTYGEYASDFKVLVESNLRCMEDFDIDIVSLISDPYRETSAFGAEIEFIQEGVPVCKNRIINTASEIKNLKNPDVYSSVRTLDRIKGAEYFKKCLKNEIPIMGWVEGPLAEACDMAGVGEMLVMLMTEPSFASILLDKCIITAKEFAKAQIEAGCDLIGIGDAICSQIDPETYRNFIFSRHKELVNYIHSLGAYVKLHICGDTTHLWPYLSQLNLDIFDPDHMTNMIEARKIFGPAVTLSGNINPVELQDMTERESLSKAKIMVHANQGKRFILSAGCEIAVNTPPANLRALRKATE